jgi:hypothetical protein
MVVTVIRACIALRMGAPLNVAETRYRGIESFFAIVVAPQLVDS